MDIEKINNKSYVKLLDLFQIEIYIIMPKSKEFIDSDSDEQQKNSGSDEEKGKASTSKKSKNKSTNNKDDVSEKKEWEFH